MSIQPARSPRPSGDTLREGESTPSSQPPEPIRTSLEKGAGDAKEVSGQSGDILVVDWDGPEDPANPKNWPGRRKWMAAVAVSSFTFISPIASSMVAPAVFQIADELHITTSVELSMTVSVFVLAYAVGPLFLGPLSEIYGRSRVLQIANLFFMAFNLACGFAQTKSQLLAFRFLSGLGGSAPQSIGGGVLGDMWNADKRGKAVAIYSLAPLLGPVVGPVAGGWIAELSTWRWVFRSTTIACGVVQLFGLYYLDETYAPILLKRKANAIKKELAMDPEKGGLRKVRTIYQVQRGDIEWKEFLIRSLLRPFALFAQEPIIQLFGLYLACAYGIIYLVLTTLPSIFLNSYHERIGIVGLHYISLGLGLGVASQINARLLDRAYKRLTAKHGVGKPEYRLPPIIPGAFLLPIGLFITGWTAQARVHWIGPDIGFALIGAGTSSIFYGVQTYIIDCFPLYAASALAAVSCLRSLAGFGFPLFAPYMYDALGYGVGDTILASISLGIGCPALILFAIYGERIRGMSKRTKNLAAPTTPPETK